MPYNVTTRMNRKCVWRTPCRITTEVMLFALCTWHGNDTVGDLMIARKLNPIEAESKRVEGIINEWLRGLED